ncbi:hypothetical protein OAO87_02265 [bacterium]|nr:hypothetical protein [bacterium]
MLLAGGTGRLVASVRQVRTTAAQWRQTAARIAAAERGCIRMRSSRWHIMTAAQAREGCSRMCSSCWRVAMGGARACRNAHHNGRRLRGRLHSNAQLEVVGPTRVLSTQQI